MHFNPKLVLTLLATLPAAFAALNGKCTGRNGICISTGTCQNYGGTSISGKCPNDPNDVKCCDSITCEHNGSYGTCMFTDQCDGEKISGLCPGGSDFKCCIKSTKVEGVGERCNGVAGNCIDVNNSSCSTQTVSGKCPGPANVKCCLDQTADPNVGKPCNGVSGTCIDVNTTNCGTRTVTGKCPGGNNILCCLNESGNRPAWYIDQTEHTEVICSIPGSSPVDKTVKSSGCGISCLSMAINILRGDNVTPETLFREGYDAGKYWGDGFSHDALIYLGENHNVSVNWTSNLDTVYSALQNGKPVIFHTGPDSTYHFTSGGHYILLYGSKTVNDVQKVYVFDPNGSNNHVNELMTLRSANGGIEVAKRGTGADFGIVSSN